jgi:hypothetical protein
VNWLAKNKYTSKDKDRYPEMNQQIYGIVVRNETPTT